MKIFKFGGASINNVDRIQNTARILQSFKDEKILIVISAMGKTTNALEQVANAYFSGRTAEALELFTQIKKSHQDAAKFLTTIQWQQVEKMFLDFFTETEWLLHDKPVRSYDYYYDQIVCCGEMLSSTLVYHHLLEIKSNVGWVDVRDIIRTDNHFREPMVNWNVTRENILQKIVPLFKKHDIIITQGFVGATDDNESTTLGREGSDYTAAIFAHSLEASSVTIWKDVDAVMSADPKKYPEASIIPQLSYAEVIEMAFYGAQVIHPKTIKPLQNKNIPLLVKSFLDPTLPGTKISNQEVKNLPPIIVNKEKQVLISFTTRDFSFMEDEPVRSLHELFALHHAKPNLTQRTAISFLACFDDQETKTHELAAAAGEQFEVSLERNLSLLTIRHYQQETIENLSSGKTILVEQKTPQTVQMLVR